MTDKPKKTFRPKKLRPVERDADCALQSAVVRGEPREVIEAWRARLAAVKGCRNQLHGPVAIVQSEE